jgi:adenylate cyclase
MDFEALGLLDGLEGEERETRLALLEQLSGDGFAIEDLQRAVAEDRLALLPVQRLLGASYTAHEIEQRTGLPARTMLLIRRLSGLSEAGPDDRVFGDEDVALAQSTRAFIDAGLGEDAIVEMTRVLGEGMSRAAATTTALFAEAFLKPGDNEREVAQRFAVLADQLLPAVQPVLVAAFKAHLRESVQRGMLGPTELEAGHIPDAQDLAVCFADLVGFTRLGGEIEVRELGMVAETLARLATELTVAPVRLVKTIGDAALFVSIEPGPLVGVALSLVEAVAEAELPSLRAGVASGPALQRAGDFYGHSVNLASRVTGIARPGSVLCTEPVRDAAPDDFDWSFAGRHRFKGIPEPMPLYRARRPSAEPSEEGVRRQKAGRPRKRASR